MVCFNKMELQIFFFVFFFKDQKKPSGLNYGKQMMNKHTGEDSAPCHFALAQHV